MAESAVGNGYPIVYMDAIQFKARDNGHLKSKALYLAIGVTMDGLKEVLGLWIAQIERAKFWPQVVTELTTWAGNIARKWPPI